MILHLRKNNPDILCLVDTRLDADKYRVLMNETNLNCYYSQGANSSRGVCILVKKNIPINISLIHQDRDGNLIVIKCEFGDHEFLLINAYGPNTDSPIFFEDIFEIIDNDPTTNVMLSGDLNVTLNPEVDNLNYVNDRNVNARKKLNDLMSQHLFIDTFREKYGEEKSFTWTSWNGEKKARLDMCLTSQSFNPYITDFVLLPYYKSDHRPIMTTVDFDAFTRGKGYWKCNNSLLKDPQYVNKIKDTIKNTCAKYYTHPVYDNFFQEATVQELNMFKQKSAEDLQSLDYNIDPNLFMDMLVNDIRNDSITYSIAKKKRENMEEERIYNDIIRLQNIKFSGTLVDNLDEELNTKQQEYNDFIENKAEKNLNFCKMKHEKFGEQPTTYFCNLEKNLSAQKYISRLKVEKNGVEEIITQQSAIADETRAYYRNLYADKDELITINSISDFLGADTGNYTKLSENQANDLEGDITGEELLSVLKKTSNDSAPGSSGLSYSFYKFFWGDLKHFILKSANHSFIIQKLPHSQRMGIISLLPKGNKPKEFLKNWRPVTLLNSIYKLISGVIAERINSVLGLIINHQQCGFVKGRYIGECIRTTYDIMEWANNNKKVGLLLLIDFEKAFDSVSFDFIVKALRFFGFKDNIVKWVETLLHNFTATINLAGNLTAIFDILRGCRQGDPIASPLFVIAIEILCIKIRNSPEVTGYKINAFEVILSLFADDCSIFLKYCANNLRNAVNILNRFYSLSGLKIQIEKTQVVCFGPLPAINYKMCEDLALNWSQNFELLGIKFNPNLQNMEINLEKKIEEIDITINNWKFRFLTPLGRCCIAKTLLLSKLSHAALVLPTLNKTTIKKIEDKIYGFIWGGSDKVARDDAKKSEKKGGLNMPDIQASWLSFKISWFRRLSNTVSAWGEIFNANLKCVYPELNKDNFLSKIGSYDILKLSKHIPSKFWQECMKALKICKLEYLKKTPEDLINSYIWDDHAFIQNNAPCKKNHYRTLSHKVNFPADTYYEGK